MRLELLRVAKSSVSVAFTCTGAKCPDRRRCVSPKMRAKNSAAAALSRAGTIVWFSSIGIATPSRPSLHRPGPSGFPHPASLPLAISDETANSDHAIFAPANKRR